MRKGRFTRANASRLGKLGAQIREQKRLQRLAAGLLEPEVTPPDPSTHLGILSWHDADGSVRRWVIAQGPRANNVQVVPQLAGSSPAPLVMGWAKLLSGLRKKLCVPRRVLRNRGD